MRHTISAYITEIKNVAAKGLFHLFTANGLIYLVGFASQLFVAGMLDPIDIGRIKIMQAYIGLTSLGVGLGFNTSMIKRLTSVNNPAEKAKILQLTLIISIVTFLLFYIVLLALNLFHLISTDKVIISLFPYYALFLLPLGFQAMLIAYYQANKEIKKMSRLQFYSKVLTVALIIGITYFLGLKGYVAALIVSSVLTILVLYFYLSNDVKIIILRNHPIDKAELRSLWDLAKFVLAANVLGNLVTSSDIYIVNYMIQDRETVGYYMFALTLVGVMIIVPTTVQQIAYPFFSEISISKTKWMSYYKKYNKLNHIFLLLMGGLAMILVPIVVKIAFRGKYDPSLGMYLLLMLGWLLNYLNSMKGTALMGVGKFNLNMHSSLISLPITLVLLLVLGHFWGLNGIILAKIFAGLSTYVISMLIFKKYSFKIQVLKE